MIPTNTLQLAASVGFLVLGLRLLLMARAEEDTAARETANLMGSAGSTADDQSVP